jgi:hypothetical protein
MIKCGWTKRRRKIKIEMFFVMKDRGVLEREKTTLGSESD